MGITYHVQMHRSRLPNSLQPMESNITYIRIRYTCYLTINLQSLKRLQAVFNDADERGISGARREDF